MKEETKNLYTAIILSILIIFGVNRFFAPKQSANTQNQAVEVVPEVEKNEEVKVPVSLPVDKVLKKDERLAIETPSVKGSVRLKGARFDFLEQTKYKQTIEKDSADVELLAPSGTKDTYFAEFGFLSANPSDVPTTDSIWESQST